MQETIEHRIIRSKLLNANNKRPLIEELEEMDEIKAELEDELNDDGSSPKTSNRIKKELKHLEHTKTALLPEFPYRPRKPQICKCEPLVMPSFLYNLSQKVQATRRRL